MKYLLTVSGLLSCLAGLAQPSSPLFTAPDYPQHYFRDPLAIPMSLAANFGELRANHYHMGLDIRTQHRENLPVYAAADGYVARVQVGPFGFGQAIYIHHPNGYTTVYGHLNRFFPALAAYVGKQQYRQQSWRVDLAIPAALFPVRQGQPIAWSGNTGGSEGPHLHFEIRLTRDDVNLNPLLFGLPVEDKVPPRIDRLAWYDGNRGIYEQSPHYLPARPRSSSGASGASGEILIVPVARIGFAISASDAQSGSSNPNGIYRAELYDNGQPVIGFQMDHIGYGETRNINAHIDYKTKMTGGPSLQQLFILPGYPFPSIYRVPGPAGTIDPAFHSRDTSLRGRAAARDADGWIDLSDGEPHSIVIAVMDTRANTSRVAIRVKFQPGAAPAGDTAGNNTVAGDKTAAGRRFYPGMVDGVETSDYAFYLGEKSLYDSALIGATVSGYPASPAASLRGPMGSGGSLPGGITPVYAIGARWIPLWDPVLVRIRLPDSDGIDWVGANPSTDRVVMVRFDSAIRDVERPEWRGAWASARFGEFGNFQLVRDTVPPAILPIGPLDGANLSRASRIAFTIRDNLGVTRGWRAELDGKWLCFTNDKGLAYIYNFDGHCGRGLHTLKVAIEDVAGNRTEQEYHFSR
jgi:murein DD-endopeptidase MepM/ murein hydrolase activator NlpD